MFIAALFTIVKNWKQPRYFSREEWIKKMYITQLSITQQLKKDMKFIEKWVQQKNHPE